MNKSVFYSFLGVFALATVFVSCEEEELPDENLSNELTLDELLSAHPDSVPLLVQRGQRRFDNYEYDSALEDAAKAFRLDSSRFDVRFLYARVLNNRAERTVDEILVAQRNFKFLLQQQPKNPAVMVSLASTFSQFEDFEKSFNYINEALRIDPKFRDAYVLKGTNYAKMGNRKLMISSYETAIQQDPEFFAGYLMLGAIYQGMNDPICVEYYRTAHELEPDNLDANYSMAYAIQHYGNPEDAKEIYRKMARDTNQYYSSQALFQLGHIHQFVSGNLDSAIYYYKGATIVEPNYVEAYHNMGVCYDYLGDKTNALFSFGKALKLDPEYTLSRNYADSIR